MTSRNERTGHMSSNDFEAADFFAKMPWDIKKTCPGHILCPQMCLKFSRGRGRPLPTKVLVHSLIATTEQRNHIFPRISWTVDKPVWLWWPELPHENLELYYCLETPKYLWSWTHWSNFSSYVQAFNCHQPS